MKYVQCVTLSLEKRINKSLIMTVLVFKQLGYLYVTTWRVDRNWRRTLSMFPVRDVFSKLALQNVFV